MLKFGGYNMIKLTAQEMNIISGSGSNVEQFIDKFLSLRRNNSMAQNNSIAQNTIIKSSISANNKLISKNNIESGSSIAVTDTPNNYGPNNYSDVYTTYVVPGIIGFGLVTAAVVSTSSYLCGSPVDA